MLAGKPVKGFLSDVTGVLYNTNHTGGAAIPGSIEAVKRFVYPGIIDVSFPEHRPLRLHPSRTVRD